jgi:hypothetical protein
MILVKEFLMKKILVIFWYWLTDKRYRYFYAQRKIVKFEERKSASLRLKEKLPHTKSNPENIKAELNFLNENGYLFLTPLLTNSEIKEVKNYFSDKYATDPYRKNIGKFYAPNDVSPDTHVSHYSETDILNAPHLLRIANDTKTLNIIEHFLGARPTLATIRVWWSTPSQSGSAEHAENFHRDVDDLNFLKLFIYLTDVDMSNGPHIYVKGSHNNTKLTEIKRYLDSEIITNFGTENIKVFTGLAGTSFLESTYGMHKGLPPEMGSRLIFQPLYTLSPTIYGPKRPLRFSSKDENALDKYVNRVYLKFK